MARHPRQQQSSTVVLSWGCHRMTSRRVEQLGPTTLGRAEDLVGQLLRVNALRGADRGDSEACGATGPQN
ncbi:hypothetical protein NDU88_005679 [Pleurodeles waltl]|uniref:Uncharacterized protein n=1 Tax=Pleurodeles waltl TaxID=8319 RepID=A0AAV7N1Y3_PLEWA|nr:hypothetical protein NDU88_005679 [Pleurodeles waltl]